MTAGELRALLELVPDDALVVHLNGYDECHVDSVRRGGRDGVHVALSGRVCRDAPAPPVERFGRWPKTRPVIDRDEVQAGLLQIVRDASASA